MIDWIIANELRALVSALVLIGIVLSVGMWVGAVNTDRKSFRDFMSKVNGKIDRILERLPVPPAVQSTSPVQLTEFGQKISTTVSAKAWAITHAPRLVAEATGKEEFDVFEICVAYVQQQSDDDPEFERGIRAGAYQHGTEPDQVKKVYEVELRDRLLELTAID